MAGRSFFPEGELQKHGFSAPLIAFLRDLAEFKDAVERIGTVENDIVNKQPLDATLTSLAAFNTNGMLAQTAPDTFAGRQIVQPAAGISVSNGTGVAGNPTLALANDLAALEALTGTNTIYYRSAIDTWSPVAIGSNLTFSSGTLDATGGGGGGGALFDPPTAASLTLASGDATNLTLTDDTDAGLLIDPGAPAAGQQVRAAYRTLTNKTLDWTLVAHLPHFKTNTNFGGWGVIAMDSTASNKAYLLGSHNDLPFVCFKFTDLTSHSLTVGSASAASGDRTEFFRIRKTGTTIYFEVAPSGKGPWVLLFSETDTTWLASRADRVGIYAYYDRGTGSKMAAVCPYFSLTGPGV